MNSTVKTIMFWVFILICLVLLWGVVQRGAGMGKDTEIPYSDLFDKVQQGLVQDAAIQGNELRGHMKATPKEQFHTTVRRPTRGSRKGDVGGQGQLLA